MTWYIDLDTGELYDPSGTVVATLDGPPYSAPDDVQGWVNSELRSLSIADLTTGRLADFAQAWAGDVEFGTPEQS
jgi:hypothetical protein